MKKIATILITTIAAMQMSNAQIVSTVGVSLNLSEQKVVTETTALYDNTTAYAYNEINTAGSWYGQFFVEQKWWDAPIYLHAEYRGVMDSTFYENTTYLGAAWCHYGKNGYLAVEPLAMWKQYQGFGAQLSVVGGWEWKYIELQHYTDIWRTHKMISPVDMYNEARFWFKAGRRISIGAIGTLYWMIPEKPALAVYLGIKCKL